MSVVDKQCVIQVTGVVQLSDFFMPEEVDLNPPLPNDMPGGYSKWEPPDPISNSEVKLLSADDSVGSPHVKVGHCQALKQNKAPLAGDFFCLMFVN